MQKIPKVLVATFLLFYILQAGACGVAFVRLRQPMPHYAEKYKDPAWGLKKLLTLMERQRHRGQDGAGIATVKFDVPLGQEYARSLRFAAKNALDNVFDQAMQ